MKFTYRDMWKSMVPFIQFFKICGCAHDICQSRKAESRPSSGNASPGTAPVAIGQNGGNPLPGNGTKHFLLSLRLLQKHLPARNHAPCLHQQANHLCGCPQDTILPFAPDYHGSSGENQRAPESRDFLSSAQRGRQRDPRQAPMPIREICFNSSAVIELWSPMSFSKSSKVTSSQWHIYFTPSFLRQDAFQRFRYALYYESTHPGYLPNGFMNFTRATFVLLTYHVAPAYPLLFTLIAIRYTSAPADTSYSTKEKRITFQIKAKNG